MKLKLGCKNEKWGETAWLWGSSREGTVRLLFFISSHDGFSGPRVADRK